MSVGSSNVDAIRRRVFEIVAENEDIDALLKEVGPTIASRLVLSDFCLTQASSNQYLPIGVFIFRSPAANHYIKNMALPRLQ